MKTPNNSWVYSLLHFGNFLLSDGGDVIIVRVSNNLNQGLSFTIHCKTNNQDLGTQVVNPGYFERFELHHDNAADTKFLFCKITWRDASIDYVIYQDARDFRRRCTTDCNWEVNNENLLGINQYSQNPDIIVQWPKNWYPFSELNIQFYLGNLNKKSVVLHFVCFFQYEFIFLCLFIYFA